MPGREPACVIGRILPLTTALIETEASGGFFPLPG